MKLLLTALVLVSLLTGCATMERLEGVRSSGEKLIDPNAVESAAMEGLLSGAEAEQIALEHAGFTAEQVSWLRSAYEIDDGKPQYEVEFHQGGWEYDYEIDAKTGEILGWSKDR